MERPDFEASAEAFAALSDPVRVKLLRDLWHEGRQSAVPFSRLRKAVGIDDSGRFTYHLKRLTGPFVEKTDEGYRLTPAGLAVVDTVVAGSFAPPSGIDPAGIDARCPDCEGRLSFAYDGGYATLRCGGCDRTVTQFLFPPRGVVARESVDAVAAAFGAYVRSVLDRAVAGVCPYCAGRMAIESLSEANRAPEGKVSFAAVCADCRGTVRVSPAALCSFEPAVVAFLHRRGVDTRTPLWEQTWYHDAAVVRRRDPPAVDVTIAAAGEKLCLRIDRAGEVVDVAGPHPQEA